MDQTFDASGVDARHAAISQHIQENNLQQAINALLDFARDFRVGREHQHAIILCANNLNALMTGERRYGITDNTRRERNEVIDRLLCIADAIRDAAKMGPASGVHPPAGRSGALQVAVPYTLEESRQIFIERRRPPPEPATAQHPLFRCAGISRKYHSRALTFTLSGVSIEIHAGEITGLVGLNGSGKSTLLRIIAGELGIDSGEISYPALGENLSQGEIRDQIAYLPQQLTSWQGAVEDNLAYYASLRGITGELNEDSVDFILYRLGLERFRQATWNQLSGGIQMRCALARALVWRPRLLIFDEPLAPLDVETQQLFLRDIRELARSFTAPLGVIISSQHLHEMEAFSDRLLVLADGSPRYYGPTQEVGEKRPVNRFELSCSASADQLRGVLSALPIAALEQVGPRFIIDVPLEVDGNALLLALLHSSELKVEYFRDISKSSRQFLHAEPAA